MRLRPLLLALLASCGTEPDRPLGQAASPLCVQDQPCTTNDGCQSGHIDCATGALVCTGLSAQADDTACANGKVCKAGACTGCGAGRTCFESSGCRKGSIDCSTGVPVCAAFVDEPNGKVCVAGACAAGACEPLPPPDAGVEVPDAGEPPFAGTVRSGCLSGNVPAALLGLALLVALPARRRG